MKTPDKSREIDRAADACLLALSGDAAGTFIRMTTIDHIRAIERAQTIHRIERRPVNAERIWEAAGWIVFCLATGLALLAY